MAQYAADPFPVTRAIADTGVTAIVDVVTAIADRDVKALVAAGVKLAYQPIRDIFLVVAAPISWSVEIAIAAINPVINFLGALARAVGDVAYALTSFDVKDLFNAVVDFPARLVDGLLNGGYGLTAGLNDGVLDSAVELVRIDQALGYAIRYAPFNSEPTTVDGPAPTPTALDVAAPVSSLGLSPGSTASDAAEAEAEVADTAEVGTTTSPQQGTETTAAANGVAAAPAPDEGADSDGVVDKGSGGSATEEAGRATDLGSTPESSSAQDPARDIVAPPEQDSTAPTAGPVASRDDASARTSASTGHADDPAPDADKDSAPHADANS